MHDEVETINALEIRTPDTELSLTRPPDKVLAEARRAALALKDVIDNKARPVKFNGQTYLEFEDWATLGRFYGITVRVKSTQFIQYGEVVGFEAVAEAILVSTGQVISSAEAVCMKDEPNWENKPTFQLKSMAQTRACAKALRNVLSWVVVLAGYKPTPAEEMDGVFPEENHGIRPTQRAATSSGTQTPGTPSTEPTRRKVPGKTITEPQAKRMYAIWKKAGWDESDVKLYLKEEWNVEHTRDILMDNYEAICEHLGTPKQGLGV